MTHVRILPFEGWAACELDREFALWLLRRHREALHDTCVRQPMQIGCLTCASLARAAIFDEVAA